MGMVVNRQDSEAGTDRHRPVHVKARTRSIGAAGVVALAFALACVVAPSSAVAKPPLLRAWAQVHGTALNGQARYFSAQNGPYVGYGGQLGLAVLYFEAFYDANLMDRGVDPGEGTATMWNQLGGGLNVPLDVGPNVRVFARANVAWVSAPYDGSSGGHGTSGVAMRAGGGAEYVLAKVFALGSGLYGGYHMFGLRDRNDNGSYFMGQLYGRFELRL